MLLFRDMKEQCCRLEPGCAALYTWQNPMSKREMIWRCPDDKGDFNNELIKVFAVLVKFC